MGSDARVAPDAQRRPSLLQRRRSSKENPIKELTLSCKESTGEPQLNSDEVQERFEVFEQLGLGSRGKVFRARRRVDQQEVALKVVHVSDAEDLIIAKKEYEILRNLRHPNIVHTSGFLVQPGGAVLVLDYFRGAVTLEDGINEVPGRQLSEEVACRLFHGLMHAIAYLHEHGVIHRDVKVDNILVVGGRVAGDLSQPRLIDFNTATNTTPLTVTGTRDYLPPEALLGNGHGMHSDVWAAGICLHFMLIGSLPLYRSDFDSDDHFGRVLQRSGLELTAGKQWQRFSGPCLLVLRQCLEISSERRPPAAALLRNDWFHQARALEGSEDARSPRTSDSH